MTVGNMTLAQVAGSEVMGIGMSWINEERTGIPCTSLVDHRLSYPVDPVWWGVGEAAGSNTVTGGKYRYAG